jgi:hypothetical protein
MTLNSEHPNLTKDACSNGTVSQHPGNSSLANSVSFLLHKATFSGEKLRSRLGWSPSVSWEEGCAAPKSGSVARGYLAE